MTGAAHTIELRGLRVVAHVGVLPEERARPQPLRVDLDVEVARASRNDDLGSTIDYAALCDLVAATLLEGRRHLLESACDDVAAAILDAYPAARAVVVAVAKVRPPVAHDLSSAGVRRRVER